MGARCRFPNHSTREAKGRSETVSEPSQPWAVPVLGKSLFGPAESRFGPGDPQDLSHPWGGTIENARQASAGHDTRENIPAIAGI